jgi:hypothetical protein
MKRSESRCGQVPATGRSKVIRDTGIKAAALKTVSESQVAISVIPI